MKAISSFIYKKTATLVALTLTPFAAHAAAIAIDFTAPIAGGTNPNDNVSGSYVTAGISNGDTITGTYIFDNDVSNANSSIIDSSRSKFVFIGAPYGASINIDSGYSFVSDIEISVEVQNNKIINDPDGYVASGTYDVLGLFGLLGDEEEWGINILGSASWFTDASEIPTSLPDNFSVFLQADDYDPASGNSIGTVLSAFDQDSVTVSDVAAVPVPAALWLFGSGLLGLIGMARRNKA